MALAPILTVEEVQEYIRDHAENNKLIDGEEFSTTVIFIAMELAVSAWNSIPPVTASNISNFPSKSLMMSGTLWKMFAGQAALLARNTMNYSDGGLQIPVEERYQIYRDLAAMYQADFESTATKLKVYQNIESGWGDVKSDYYTFPIW